MTDVSAQAFREAAETAKQNIEFYRRVLHDHDESSRLLFSERCRELLLAAAEQREQLEAERLVVDVITQKQQAQIATLTAERDLLTKVNARVTDLLTTVTAERDEARAKIEQIRRTFEDFGETDDSVYNEGWLDAAMTVMGILS